MKDNVFNPHIRDFDHYKELYKKSVDDPSKFFAELAQENLDWIEPFSKTHNNEFCDSKWFEGGKTNISLNCIDRHLEKNATKIALIWEGDDPDNSKNITFQELHDEVCKFANVLKSLGIKKGSRVCIYTYDS